MYWGVLLPNTIARIVVASQRTKVGKAHRVTLTRFFGSMILWALAGLLLICVVSGTYRYIRCSHSLRTYTTEIEQRFALVCEAQDWQRYHPPYVSGGQDRSRGVDCSGFVTAVYRKLSGIDFLAGPASSNGVRKIYDWCNANGHPVTFRRPTVGDIVFFDRTTDPKKNLTHIGFVESTFPDNSFVVISATGPICPAGGSIVRTRYPFTDEYSSSYGAIRGFAFVRWYAVPPVLESR
jgi:hypothetical protein